MLILFLLIIILSGLGAGIFFINKYENTISSLRLDLRLAKKQLDTLINQSKTSDKSFTIEFCDIDYIYGTLEDSSNIYLSPDLTSPCLYINTESLKVNIIEKALVENNIWYYVELPIDSNINSKGWVISSSFSNLYNEPLSTTYNEQDNIVSDEKN